MRAILSTLLVVSAATAQSQPYPYSHVQRDLDSGYVANPANQAQVVFTGRVEVVGAVSLRLYFDRRTNLEEGTRLRLTSVHDGAIELFDSRSLAEYKNYSSWFNGSAVRVEVIAAAHTTANRVKVVAVDAGEGVVAGIQTICGPTDDRQLSSDRRAGRQHPTGCTAWLIDKHTVLTAGHCTANTAQEIHFNVPLSQSSGTIVLPPPSDQYRYDTATLRRLDAGVGADWTVTSTLRNATTGLYAGQAQGDHFDLAVPPAFSSGHVIRITGYGTTSPRNNRNQVQQTHTGPRVNTTRANAMGYQTDTTGGNSGSPVILENTGEAVGIHTHGGCQSSGSGNNWGTAYNRADFQAAVRAVTPLKRPGCYELFGRGCHDAQAPPTLTNDGFPDLGRSMDLVVGGAPARAPVAFLIGVRESTPIDLTRIGMRSCLLYTTIAAAPFATAGAAGEASLTVSFPVQPGLLGGMFTNQGAVVDGSANTLGIALTNGGEATVGQ